MGDASETAQSMNGEYVWPYEHPPYGIQVNFMKAMKRTLDNGNCGIFESPTGTGKTSSIICSVVPWIMHNWDKDMALLNTQPNSEEPSWVFEQQEESRMSKIRYLEKLRTRRDDRYLKNESTLGTARSTGPRSKRIKAKDENDASSSDDDYDEDSDEECSERKEEVEELSTRRKLYFCSRTHTQLAQFLAEVKRVFPNRELSAITLGSRAQLCVNDQIRTKYVGERLNEVCLDMQDGSSSKRCPYLENPTTITHLADAQLYEVRDVEDLISAAKKKCGCAYYASREAAKSAMIVAVPYAALISKNTREALGIDIEGNVVVCDEAHNLVDAVAESHTALLSLNQISNALGELKAYREKYASRFNLNNAASLVELASVLTKLTTYLTKDALAEQVLVLDEFVRAAKLSENDLFTLVRKAKDSQLHKKLKGVAKDMKRENTSIMPCINFLEALNSATEDGRVSVAPKTGLKFLLLNPGAAFAQIVEKAHSVILTGGTMHPVDDVIEQLFPGSRKVDHFTCGHVIPDDNLRAFQIGVGPWGKEIRLTFETRNDTSMLDSVSASLKDICINVPEGVVVFLPSYSFQEQLHAHWKETNFASTLNKSLVMESKIAANSGAETTFEEYERLLKENPRGCMLVAVVGGKLSEGINFCDHLARCVVMVGMPYPNRHNTELNARMNYCDEHFGSGSGGRFFENKCWKAVNQSIGRAIRHKHDYACVVFLDSRYANSRDKLPGWIRKRFERCNEWEQVIQGLRAFFRGKSKSRVKAAS